ncbi:hypothetical protein G7Z17_g2758 [Cylindrodendrum hubeiense]|uniref:DUF7779 domain-containing protein n=1 Tax=Cylindrodendrum hubeiense TaxID=595255 RepID=A0A9P5HC28_9HYPO|nr:hypothetical protein G7Z17_g2758 [Cylindrodendrum hubeiense]
MCGLGYLPLAIVQASIFILECDCTLEEFQELYHSAHQSNQSISDLETSSVNLFYEYSLATVWRVSILKLGKNALKLLRLMSYFDPHGVPEFLLWEGSKKSGVPSLKFLKRGFPYHTAVQELISRGLIIKAETSAVAGYGATKARSLTIHRLVQETVFHQLSEEEQAQLLDDALGSILAHVRTVPPTRSWSRGKMSPRIILEASDWFYWGCACTGLGELDRAEELFQEGLSVAKNIADKKTYKDWRVHIAHNLSLTQSKASFNLISFIGTFGK